MPGEATDEFLSAEDEAAVEEYGRALHGYCDRTRERPRISDHLPAAHPYRRLLYRALVQEELDILVRRLGKAQFEDYLPGHPDPAPTDEERWHWAVREGVSRVTGWRREDPAVVVGDMETRLGALATPSRLESLRQRLLQERFQTEPPSPRGYRIGREIGRSRVCVYEAEQLAFRRDVAIKVFPAAGALGRVLNEVREEASRASLIKHPNIVEFIDLIAEHGHVYLVMEYLPGGNLAERLGAGQWSLYKALDCVAQIARGVDAAHRSGIVHRDLKLQNVLLDAGGRPKVIDFGLHHAAGDHAVESGRVYGTVHSMAPEQAAGTAAEPLHKIDIFGVGAIFYHLLTGRPLYPAATNSEALRDARGARFVAPRRLYSDLPVDVERVLMRALDRDPAARHDSAEQLAGQLRELADRYDPARQPESRPPRRPLIAGLGVLAACLAVPAVLLLGLFLAVRNAPDSTDSERAESPQSAKPPLAAHLSVTVWPPGQKKEFGLDIRDPRAVPVRDGDNFRLEARVNRPAYLYLLQLDTEGKLWSLDPWPGLEFEPRASEVPRAGLAVPPDGPDGGERMAPIAGGPAGLETFLLLARDEPLGDDAGLRRLFAELPPEATGEFRCVVWTRNGSIVRGERDWKGRDRGPLELEKSLPFDQILPHTRTLLRGEMRKLFADTTSVSFPRVPAVPPR